MIKKAVPPLAGMDIGANTIRLVDKEEGIVFEGPCAVALNRYGQGVLIGNDAAQIRDFPDKNLKVVYPFAQKPVDMEALCALLEQLCYEYRVFRLFHHPELLVSIPSSMDREEAEKLEETLISLGAGQVYVEEQVWISAIGAGLNINHPVGSVVLHIGYSDCEIALFCMGKLLLKESCSLQGKSLERRLQAWLASTMQLLVSEATLKKILEEAGSFVPAGSLVQLEIHGQDTRTRNVKHMILSDRQVLQALMPFAQELGTFIQQFLLKLPEKFQQDVRMRGIVACGGLVKQKGLLSALQSQIGLPVFATDDPQTTTAKGLQILMRRMETLAGAQ